MSDSRAPHRPHRARSTKPPARSPHASSAILVHRILEEAWPASDDPCRHHLLRRAEAARPLEALRATPLPAPRSDLRLLNAFRSPAQFRLIFEEFFWLECGLELKRRKARMHARHRVSNSPTASASRSSACCPSSPPARRSACWARSPATWPSPTHEPPAAGRRRQRQDARGRGSRHHRHRKRLPGGGARAHRNPGHAALLLLQDGSFRSSATSSSCSPAPSPPGRRRSSRKLLAAGLAHVVVGTHALLEEDVEFAKLGLAIIDEQHRFGVVQRLKLMEKGSHPDVLVMTATPIPRTLALTIYGDLDVASSTKCRPGRKPIVTKHVDQRSGGAGLQLSTQGDRRRAPGLRRLSGH